METINTDINKCWWCGSSDLSREHKIKQTDIKAVYGKSFFENDSLGQLKFKTHSRPIPVKSTKSKLIQFPKSICKNCNNSKSSQMDRAYELAIRYILENTQQICDEKTLNFREIFNDNWEEGKMNFYKYLVKYVSCRMVESGLEPLKNFIHFLNGEKELKDVKFVFQIKPYQIGPESNPIKTIFTGKFNIFEQQFLFFGMKKVGAASWYSINDFSVNYIIEEGVNDKFQNRLSKAVIPIEIVNMSKFDKNVKFSKGTEYKEYGELIENLEYHPFEGIDRAIQHFNYLKNYE